MGTSNGTPALIDVDSHFVEPPNWLELVDPELSREVAAVAPTSIGEQAIGEVFESIPVEGRPPFEEFVPEGLRTVFAKFEGREGAELDEVFADHPEIAVMFNPPGGRGGADRVKFCDERGIGLQVINPNLAMAIANSARRADQDLGLRVASAYNTWAATAVDGYTDRLLYTTVLLLDDLDWAVAELKRNRKTGSRTFAMPLNPINGRGLGDPIYDPLWRTALDIGMTPLIHVGFGWPKVDPDWMRVGDGFDPRMSMSMSVTLMSSLPQSVLSHMVHRGVFDRFPELIVFCQEFGLAWIGQWLDALGPMTRAGTPNGNMFFGWDHKSSPEDILARNIRFSPLNGHAVDAVIEEFGPDLVCYATDYPHFEGIAQDWTYYDRQLERFSDDVKDRFFVGNAADLLAL
jgi:predicted TIM-barrel fold metal-dependent hydrolase